MEILSNPVFVRVCVRARTPSACASTSARAISIPSLGCPQKRLSWKSPAVDVIVLRLFPYLGRFNILFYCLACQQLWPRYLPFPVIQECSGPFEPKHSLCLYHRPRETPGLLIHLRIILKQITFNRQGQGTMKICDPCVPRSSRWQCWTLWAGLAAEHFIEPILGLDGDQDVIECVSGLLNLLTGRQSQHRHSGLNTPQRRSCWAIALSLSTQFHFIWERCASTSENSLSSGNKGV